MNQVVCLTIGQSGDGKSSLLNSLIGKEVFESNDSQYMVTKNIQCHTIRYGGMSLVLIDTPGLNTSDDSRLLNMIVQNWPNPMRLVHWFILVLNSTNSRVGSGLLGLLRSYKNLCGELFENCVVVFKHCESPTPEKCKQFRNFLEIIWKELEIELPETGIAQFFIDSNKATSSSFVKCELGNLKIFLSKSKNPVKLSTSRLLSSQDQIKLSLLYSYVKVYVTSLDITQTTLKADILEICKTANDTDEDKFRALELNYIKYLKENLENKLPNKICESIAKIILEYLKRDTIIVPPTHETIRNYLQKTMKEIENLKWVSLNYNMIGITSGIVGVLGTGSIISGILEGIGIGAGVRATTTGATPWKDVARATTTGATATGATAVGATAAGATAVGATAAGATAVGATVAGATAVGATAVGATAVGTTAVGATAVGGTVGATAVGGTAVGATAVGATTAGAVAGGAAGGATGGAGGAVTAATIGTVGIVLACVAVAGGIGTTAYMTQGWNRNEVIQNVTQQLLDHLIKENYQTLLQELAEETYLDIISGSVRH